MSGIVGGKLLNEIKSIDLFVTEECNMDCSYCFHPKGVDVLSINQGKKILDRLHELSPSTMQITFFGGEPLLYPDTILTLSNYARTLWKKSTFSITTNGTYFDEKVFKKMKELGFSLMVSCDGDEITTNEHRKGGDWQTIVDNIKKMLVIFPDLSVRMTYTPKTVGRLAINVEFLHQLGITKIMFHAVMEANWVEDDVKKYEYQLRQIYHYRRFCLKKGIPIALAFVDKPLKIINDEMPPEKQYCEAGKSYIAILSSGDVYPCHRAASQRIFKLGNLFEDIPFIRGMFLTIDKESTGCWKFCEAANTCHSCIITHYLVNKELTKPIADYCKLCILEHKMARDFLPVELNDRYESMQFKIASGLVAVADQNDEIMKLLKEKQ
jgi:uncharacterized protein